MASSFLDAMQRSMQESARNNYTDNWDFRRFGPEKSCSLTQRAKDIIKRILESVHLRENKYLKIIKEQSINFEWLYQSLDDEQSRALLVQIMTFRTMGYRKVKLPLNNQEYWEKQQELDKLASVGDAINLGFLDWTLNRYDLRNLGYPIQLYARTPGVYSQLIIQQYKCQLPDNTAIEVMPGDIVIDAGGCYGDTALYFAHKATPSGKIYSFEFMPDNLSVFEKNLSLNPELAESIKTIMNPIWSSSGEKLFVEGSGPAAYITSKPKTADSQQVETLSIDELAAREQCQAVNFIKMDIEGAEAEALRGAEKTIRTHKPKLAISVYHKPNDIWSIAKWIDNLGLGYSFHLRHFTIHNEETVLFASVKQQ